MNTELKDEEDLGLPDKDILNKIKGAIGVIKYFDFMVTYDEGFTTSYNDEFPFYALLHAYYPTLNKDITITITNRADFSNLMQIYKMRGLKRDEEVQIVYNPTEHYLEARKRGYGKFLPRFVFLIAKKGTNKLQYDFEFQKRVTPSEFHDKTKPLLYFFGDDY